MALSKYILRRVEENPNRYVPFEEFKLDDYDGPTLGCRDAILAVVWKFASREIMSRKDAWICLTPIIPFSGIYRRFPISTIQCVGKSERRRCIYSYIG